jgi:hypothetical protein
MPRIDEEIEYSKLHEAYYRYGLSDIIKGIKRKSVRWGEMHKPA